MQNPPRVIQLAKEAAQTGFFALAQHIIAAADENIAETMSDARSSFDRSALSGARDFLRRDGGSFAKRLLNFYSDYLSRAMQTMYTDLRAEQMQGLSADHLTLIDDESMNRQIEVDRLAQRLRDADQENLGRLNIMISQLHGEHEIRERENPFRPYLLARSLHDVLNEMVKDASIKGALFEQLAKTMVIALPTYYRAIRDVFEMSGVHAQLIARPSMLSAAQRNMLARQAMQSWQGANVYPAGMPMVPAMPGAPVMPGAPAIQGTYPAQAAPAEGKGFPDLVRQIFKLPHGGTRNRPVAPAAFQGGQTGDEAFQNSRFPEPGFQNSRFADQGFQNSLFGGDESQRSARKDAAAPGIGILKAAPDTLLAKLTEFQKQIMAGQPIEGQLPLEQNQLFAVRQALEQDIDDSKDQVTIEIVALLFEFILRDRLVPGRLREQIGRMQVPFLKAAMMAPEMLQQPDHPARQLLNRMGSFATSIDPDSPEAHAIETEIGRITDSILKGFDRDPAIFTDSLKEFDEFVATRVQASAPNAEALADAINEAEMLCTMAENIARSLDEVLGQLKTDARIREFIMQTWSRVLAYAAYVELYESDEEVNLPQLDIVPELIWSAQSRQTQQDRSALMRFLPGFVTKLKQYLQATPMSPAELQQALDRLVEVHTDVLKSAGDASAEAPLSLEDLYERFAAVKIDVASWDEAEPAPVAQGIVEAALVKHKAVATLMLKEDSLPIFSSDVEMLAQMQPGVAVECALEGFEGMARLSAVSRKRALYAVTSADGQSAFVFSSNALIKAFRGAQLKKIENMPMIERAIESLMIEAESV